MTKVALMTALSEEMDACKKCHELSKKNGPILDDGDIEAEIMIIAEAAGADEEEKCLPLIGKCGKLIEEMLFNIGLGRRDTWRANVCACRPPSNRDPNTIEIANCDDFLRRQIEIVQPKILILLGKFAAQTVLGSDKPISKLLGWHEAIGSSLRAYVMYHPSYILRNGNSMIDYYKSQFQEVVKKRR